MSQITGNWARRECSNLLIIINLVSREQLENWSLCFDVSAYHNIWPSISFYLVMLNCVSKYYISCLLFGRIIWLFACSLCWHVCLFILNSGLQLDNWHRLHCDLSHTQVSVSSPLLKVIFHSKAGRMYNETDLQPLEGYIIYLRFVF